MTTSPIAMTMHQTTPVAMKKKLHASMAADARWYERLLPWLYARRMNARNMAALQELYKGKIVLMDFI